MFNILVSLSENFCLVFLDVGNVFLAYRDIVLQVEVVVNSTERQSFLFLQESQALEELALVLILAESIERLKECLQQRLLGSTYADDISSDTIDGTIEIVETDVCTVERLARTNSEKRLRVLSSKRVTWSESQCIGRDTWSISSGTKSRSAETASETFSVGS